MLWCGKERWVRGEVFFKDFVWKRKGKKGRVGGVVEELRKEIGFLGKRLMCLGCLLLEEKGRGHVLIIVVGITRRL